MVTSDEEPSTPSSPDSLRAGGVHLEAHASGEARVHQAARDLHLYYGDGVGGRQRAMSGAVGQECPYPGLAAFGREQAQWFFGRDQLVAELIGRLDERLRTGGVQVVLAPSGAGKSSLLSAGLLSTLDRGALPGSARWPKIVFTPGVDPIHALVEQISSLIGEAAPAVDDLTTDPRKCIQALREAVRHCTGEKDLQARAVIVVDQFEELFTLCSDLSRRRSFVDLLCQIAGVRAEADDERPAGLVVIGVRADFYTACTEDPQLRLALQDRPLLAGPMSTTELREAILYPAQTEGLDLEPGLIELLMRDLGVADGDDATASYEPGRLPLLAHALRASWQQRNGATITVQGYQDTGGIQRAIATTADHTFSGLDAAAQRVARSIFLRLIKIGDGTEDIRRPIAHADLVHGSTDSSVSAVVVSAFTQARLLTLRQDTVEITHEALLRSWPRLHGWINADRSSRLIHQNLEEAAASWERERRDASVLYHGSQLKVAKAWSAAASQEDLGPLTRAFLSASVRRRRRGIQLRAGLVVLVVLALGAGAVSLYLGKRVQDANIGDLQQRETADRTIRERAVEFERIRQQPIRELEVSAQIDTLPQDGSVMEVRITHDMLFSQPMSFFLTSIRHGRVWPTYLDIPEPTAVEFPCRGPAMDGWFRWYEKNEDLTSTIPLAGDPWGYSSIEFSGEEFRPSSPLSLPQRFELPPISTLVEKSAKFELFRYPATKGAPERVDPAQASEHIEVSAVYGEQVQTSFTLFRSHHTEIQQQTLGVNYLYHRPPIEQEALLGLYKPAATVKGLTALGPADEQWRNGKEPKTPEENATFAAFENNAGVLKPDAVESARHFERGIKFGMAAADQLGRDPSALPGRNGLCAATFASLRLSQLIKPDSDQRLAVLQESVTRLGKTPRPYRDSPQVHRWLADTYMVFAKAFAERGDREKALRATQYAIDEAAAGDQNDLTLPSADELLRRIQSAEKIRTALRPAPESPNPAWRPIVDQACARINAVIPADATSKGNLPDYYILSCANGSR
ncbi:hypothetical protein Rhe02_78410 [Rhizocola hellebori]|uniref:Novel STAND NTPase 1 domain-containing protein n=1 Tax=Rhizocola hellebori TaxID=1392758 RepID=A0A8J3VJU9_9ACTN|nr:hypothetical protein [Rhizocola hellebori]GIH09774.1 hypothetical protein Rhe02_78410 [Rhizocola hellebori]